MNEQELVKLILPKDFVYEFTKFTSTDDAFSIQARCDITSGDQFKKWRASFDKLSNTAWRFDSWEQGGRDKSFSFARKYNCRHEITVCKYERMFQTKGSDDPFKECPASLEIRIDRDIVPSKCGDDGNTQKSLPGLIKIYFIHNHIENGRENWIWLKRSHKTIAALLQHFKNGMSPTEARIFQQYANVLEVDNPEAGLSIRKSCLKYFTNRIYANWIEENPVEKNVAHDFKRSVAAKKAELEREGCAIYLQEDPFCVSIVTPLMRRLLQSLDRPVSVLIDSNVSSNEQRSTITLAFVPTKAGSIPVAFGIHHSRSQCSYRTVFYGFHVLWETIRSPKISRFITEDDVPLRSALQCVWPETGQRLFEHRIPRTVWKLVRDYVLEIPKHDRKSLIDCVVRIVAASTKRDADSYYRYLTKMSHKYPDYRASIEHLYRQRKEWCKAYRTTNAAAVSNVDDNYAEATVRLAKDIILTTVKNFGPIVLVDFVFRILDKCYSARLLDVANGRLVSGRPLFRKDIDDRASLVDNAEISKIGSTIFAVSSTKTFKVNLTVPSLGVCSCIAGLQGALCKHQTAVRMAHDIAAQTPPAPLSSDDKRRLSAVAVGETVLREMEVMKSDRSEIDVAEEDGDHLNLSHPFVIVGEMTSETGVGRAQNETLATCETQMLRIHAIVKANMDDEELVKCAENFVGKLENVTTALEMRNMFEKCIGSM